MAQEKKPWWQSKIFVTAVAVVLIFGTNLLTKWLTGQGVSAEQLDAIRLAYPDIAAAIERIQNGESWLTNIGLIAAALIAIFRLGSKAAIG